MRGRVAWTAGVGNRLARAEGVVLWGAVWDRFSSPSGRRRRLWRESDVREGLRAVSVRGGRCSGKIG